MGLERGFFIFLASLGEKGWAVTRAYLEGKDIDEVYKSFLKRRKEFEKVLEDCKSSNIEVLTVNEYPEMLREIPMPPPCLFIKGSRDILFRPSIAVVGTRKASQYGRFVARKLGEELSTVGVTVVSGLARGIDAEAHLGALEGEAKTVAVLGSGVDVVYPRENERLYRRIEEEGVIVSPFLPGEKPYKWHFPLRNRIVAGLSYGTVVVECPRRSGAMITARLSLEYGREVFAVPGNITSGLSEGPNYLISEGAKVVTKVDDILEELPLNFGEREDKRVSQEELRVIELIKEGFNTEEELLRKTGLSFPELSGVLLSLELKGILKVSFGKIHLLGG